MYDVDFHGFHFPKVFLFAIQYNYYFFFMNSNSIPNQGTSIVANLTACHRDPKYWKNPEKFDPEHFLDENGHFVEDKDSFVPYGIGNS